MKHTVLLAILVLSLATLTHAQGPISSGAPELGAYYDYAKEKIVFKPATADTQMKIKKKISEDGEQYTIRLSKSGFDDTVVTLTYQHDSYIENGEPVKRSWYTFQSLQYGDEKKDISKYQLITKKTGKNVYMQRLVRNDHTYFKVEYNPDEFATFTYVRSDGELWDSNGKNGLYPIWMQTMDGKLDAWVNFSP